MKSIQLSVSTQDDDDHHNHHGKDEHDEDTWFGVRGPVGLNFEFQDPRIEVFTEIAIVMDIVPETEADFEIGIGARYYFQDFAGLKL